MNHSVKRRHQALHQTHHHYYLNISVQAANVSNWRIESNRKNRFGSENRIETFLPELECSTLSSALRIVLLDIKGDHETSHIGGAEVDKERRWKRYIVLHRATTSHTWCVSVCQTESLSSHYQRPVPSARLILYSIVGRFVYLCCCSLDWDDCVPRVEGPVRQAQLTKACM